jgi:oxygen-dependent protoporphyrinogen oxidase
VGLLPTAVADSVVSLGGEIRTDAAVRSIHRIHSHWRVIVSGDPAEVLEAEEVVLAVPPDRASELLMHVSPTAANDLGLIDLSSMGIVSLAYPAAAVAPMSGSGFLVPLSEGRLVKAANYASSKWDWIARQAHTRARRSDALVLIRASVGRLGETAALDRDDDDLVGKVHAELTEAVGISAAPVDQRVTRWRDAIPQYTTGHVRRVERIRSAIAGIEGLHICGAAFDGVGVAAVIGSARVAARGVLSRGESARGARVGQSSA